MTLRRFDRNARWTMPYLWFALILVCWGMVGCGSDGDSASSPVTVVLEMDASVQQQGASIQSIPEDVSRIQVKIEGPDMDTLSEEKTIPEETDRPEYVTFLFFVPNGNDRKITIQAWDQNDTLQWTGESDLFTVPTPDWEPVVITMRRVENETEDNGG